MAGPELGLTPVLAPKSSWFPYKILGQSGLGRPFQFKNQTLKELTVVVVRAG